LRPSQGLQFSPRPSILLACNESSPTVNGVLPAQPPANGQFYRRCAEILYDGWKFPNTGSTPEDEYHNHAVNFVHWPTVFRESD